MNDLNRQVQHAQRRLNFQQFLSVVFWVLTSTFAVAAIGVAIPKIWPLSIDPVVWQWAWVGGSVFVGLAVAFCWTVIHRRNELDAAIEIDRRFGLKERVSSCLSLNETELKSEAGQALVNDAVRRVAEVDVKEKFQVSPSRWAWMPFVMAGIVFAITFLADAQLENSGNEANAATVQSTKRIKKSTNNLKKTLKDKQKQALEQGLEEATDIFKKIEAGVDRLQSKNKVDKQEALVKLNDFSEELKKRAREIGDPDKLKQQLNQLRDLKEGPADKIARSMKNGNFKAAIDAVKELKKQLENGELSDEKKEQLAQQLEQLKEKLQQMADAHESQKQELQQKIQEKLAAGDRQGAAELQKKLDDTMAQDSQMNNMQQMAQKMGQMQKSMQKGDAQQAAQQLSELAEDLEGMQEEMEELELLEGAMEQIADARNSMNCENCNGEGCSMCQGDGMGIGGLSQLPGGMGMGEGQGQGDRPESETPTGYYDSQVAAKPGKGKAVVIGSAGGPNKPGQALEEIQQQFEAAQSADDDPLTGIRLPKPQRELTRQYFDKFKE